MGGAKTHAWNWGFARQLALCALAASSLFAFLPATDTAANPAGGQVTAGQATISPSGATLNVIQSTNRAIINWQSFSIGAGETTKFLQPSSMAAILNRVIGGNLSSIYGTLSANGQVYLINPNGILIGPSGVVNTRSFVGSTLDVPDQQFLQGGSLTFSGSSSASVVNLGAITASGGDVFLFANSVQNSGSITAPNGTVGLAAGSTVLLAEAGEDRVFVQAGGPGGQVGVDQEGVIAAASAALKAAGGNIYALAINNGGTVQATAVQNVGGRIILAAPGGNVQSSGTLEASNGSEGGTVKVLGDKVALTGNAVVDVSGDQGGGTAVIGSAGGASGAATRTTIGQGAAVLADARVAGNGGTVIVRSSSDTEVAGSISAQGGPQGGNGGTVELSSGGTLNLSGSRVNVGAPRGQLGTIIIDPTVLTDNFTQDASLNGTLWIVNGPVATAALTNFDVSPTATVVTPTATFSSTKGLGLNGAAGGYQEGGIQSVQSFSPPFTVTVQAQTSSIGAGAIQLAISSSNGGSGVSIVGGQGGLATTTGFTYNSPSGPGTHWALLGQLSSATPTLNVTYTLTISVDASGNATVTVQQGATTIGQSTVSVGTGPFYVIMSVGSGAFTSGNQNQAFYSSAQVTTTTTSPTTTPTTPAPTTTATPTPTPTAPTTTTTTTPTPPTTATPLGSCQQASCSTATAPTTTTTTTTTTTPTPNTNAEINNAVNVGATAFGYVDAVYGTLLSNNPVTGLISLAASLTATVNAVGSDLTQNDTSGAIGTSAGFAVAAVGGTLVASAATNAFVDGFIVGFAVGGPVGAVVLGVGAAVVVAVGGTYVVNSISTAVSNAIGDLPNY